MRDPEIAISTLVAIGDLQISPMSTENPAQKTHLSLNKQLSLQSSDKRGVLIPLDLPLQSPLSLRHFYYNLHCSMISKSYYSKRSVFGDNDCLSGVVINIGFKINHGQFSEGFVLLFQIFSCTMSERAQWKATHANKKKNTSKLRKHLHRFDSTRCKCSQRKPK